MHRARLESERKRVSVNVDRVEGFVELFHHYYTALASDFGCASGQQPEWRELDRNEQKRLIAATHLALMEATCQKQAGTAGSVFANQGTEGRECGC
jgi:hypothetical protein